MSAPPHRRPSYRHAGRRRVLYAALMLGLAAAAIAPATAVEAAARPGTPVLHQSSELVSRPPGSYSRQGSDVALSGDGSTLAVANLTYSFGPSAVVVYVRSGDRWVIQTTLRPPSTETGADLWGSAIAISADGDTLAVGDPRATVLASGTSVPFAGVVHLYTRSGRAWRAAGQLVAPQPQWVGRFGTDVSVSADGGRVAVGSNSYQVHAFIADTRSRVVQELPAPAGATSFGYSVAISPDGETVVVGAPYGGRHPRLGGAFVLVNHPVSGWIRRWHLEAQPLENRSYFGVAVAVSDNGTVVVGAPNSPSGVSVFDRLGAALVRTARFTPRYEARSPDFGFSVAVSADGATVVAGAPYRAAAGGSIPAAGAGYRWVRSPGGWSFAGFLSVAHPNAGEDQGLSTAVSGDGRVVVLGAPGRSSAQRGETGAAIIFSAASSPPGEVHPTRLTGRIATAEATAQIPAPAYSTP